MFFVYALVISTGLLKLFESLFVGEIRAWKKSSIVLLHLLSKFTTVDKVYKINKNLKKSFYYFFDRNEKRNPLKDDVYEFQKQIPDSLGQNFKETLLKYYYNNNFLDLNLTFIDGHVIAYFGKEAFQKLKHSTRGKIMKCLEVFNFSDKNGRIFYFKADHDVEGMQKNIEKLLDDMEKIIGLDKVKMLAFDRGGYCGKLFEKLKNKYAIKFITLAVQHPDIKKQIKKIRKNTKFKKLKTDDNKKYAVSELKIEGKKYRALLILNKESNKISPFITNMDEEELSNEELLQYYSMHWNQEQEHNAFIKLGGDKHVKVLQDAWFDDTTKIKQKAKLKNKINNLNCEIIRLNIEAKRLGGKKIYLTSKIKPKSKRTDNKLIRQEIKYIDKRLKEISQKVKELLSNLKKAKKRLKNIPDNPKKKKYKHGPIDYSISITNLANNLNSKLVETFSNGKKKFQLATIKSILYCISAKVWEDEKFINIEYFNLRQDKDREGVEKLCDYFNEKNVKLYEKIIKFTLKKEKKNKKNKET